MIGELKIVPGEINQVRFEQRIEYNPDPPTSLVHGDPFNIAHGGFALCCVIIKPHDTAGQFFHSRFYMRIAVIGAPSSKPADFAEGLYIHFNRLQRVSSRFNLADEVCQHFFFCDSQRVTGILADRETLFLNHIVMLNDIVLP